MIEVGRPGSTRALIYVWRDQWPTELPPTRAEDGRWLLQAADYKQTDDLANAWALRYARDKREGVLEVAVVEYVSATVAGERYDTTRSRLGPEAVPLAVNRAERACARNMPARVSSPDLDTRSFAVALSGRYLLAFSTAERAVDLGAVQKVLDSLLATVGPPPGASGVAPPVSPEAAPVESPAAPGGDRRGPGGG